MFTRIRLCRMTDLLLFDVHPGPGQRVQQYYDVDGYAHHDADFQTYQQRAQERGESRYQVYF